MSTIQATALIIYRDFRTAEMPVIGEEPVLVHWDAAGVRHVCVRRPLSQTAYPIYEEAESLILKGLHA